MELYSDLYKGYIADYAGWSMSFAERYAFIGLLEFLRPRYSIEIGTDKGGSSAVLAHFSQQVYALDLDPQAAQYLKPYPNIEFVQGYSQKTLPPLLEKLKGEPLAFMLIDGDHSTQGVYEDCENLLAYQPSTRFFVVMHDCFNPDVRKGILAADWAKNPYVHHVIVDFVPGVFSAYPETWREMWGGLAVVMLEPHPRPHNLVIEQHAQALWELVLPQSVHYRHVRGLSKLQAILRQAYRKWIYKNALTK